MAGQTQAIDRVMMGRALCPTLTSTDMVAFLSDPAAYSPRPDRVETIETHRSWLFLTGRRAFKLKKPVKLPFLDFSTVRARHDHCINELMLNRRMASGVYRRVLPLIQRADGTLSLDGHGEVVDWLIEMEQLPAGRMLDVLVRRQQVTITEIVGLAVRLANFYASAQPRRGGSVYLEHIWRECRVSRDLLTRRDFGLNAMRAANVIERTERLIDRWTPEIRARIGRGLIVMGHGDLKPEHVCLIEPPVVFDCIEFDARLLFIDPYDEVGYLGLECERLGAGWIRPLLLSVLEEIFGDRPDPRLMRVYAAFRAMLRAQIAIAHLLDPEPSTPGRWQADARAYLSLAEQQCNAAEI